jgi:RNA polymerase sigma-70 factor (ECF subfamily)
LSFVAAREDPVADATGPRADAEVLDGALARLPVEQRAVLVLHHLEGRTVAELATILDVPLGTAKSRLFAARRALADAIEQEEGR